MKLFLSRFAHRSGLIAVLFLFPGGFCFSQDTAPSPEEAKLLEQLEKIAETVAQSRTGNSLVPVDSLREAAASDAKAVDLWLDSVREMDFRGKDKKEAEWRQWKDGATKRLHAPGAGTALRLHFQFLLLTIKASTAATEGDKTEVIGNLVSYFDDLARGGKDMLANRGPLDQPVLGTPVSRRFKLDDTVTALEGWPALPSDITGAYEGTILPFYRGKKDASRLQSVWNKRVQQEAALIAAAESDFQARFFREVTQPRLEWGMAKDLFEAGNRQVATRMLLVIQQHPAHRDAPSWIKEMKLLLSKENTAAGTSPDGARSGVTPPSETAEETVPPEAIPEAPQAEEDPSPESPPPVRRTSTTSNFPPNLRPGR